MNKLFDIFASNVDLSFQLHLGFFMKNVATDGKVYKKFVSLYLFLLV